MEQQNISIDESAILAKVRSGEAAAMEKLILRYQGRIYNTILRMCGNEDDAAELTQDTFVKAIEKINSFQGQSNFYTWIFRIAVNHTLNFCKRKFKIGFQSLEAAVQDDGDVARGQLKDFLVATKTPDPAELAQKQEMYELVFKAVMELDNDQRMVVVLRDIEGMNYAQIAEVLEVQLGTVRSRLSRARTNLKEILNTVL